MVTSTFNKKRAGTARIALYLVIGLIIAIAGVLIVLRVAASTEGPPAQGLDLSRDGSYTSGPWQYVYSIGNKGTRSEGYYGKLLYGGQAVPEPAKINDHYETPWGKLYWVGQPATLFGGHGWMPRPLVREPVGRNLPDPSIVAERTFVVWAKVLTADELGTPDRIETEEWVLAALEPFGLKQAHVQRDWFGLGPEWIPLHDTKRWGFLELRLAEPAQEEPLAVELHASGDLTVETAQQQNSFEALIPQAPQPPLQSQIVELPPQDGATCVIKCTLSSVIDTLELFLAFRVEGPSESTDKTATLKVETADKPLETTSSTTAEVSTP